MKKLSFSYKILYIFNVVFAMLLALSYLTSFISPKTFPFLAIVNFSIPLLWLINFCFILIWLLKLKKYFILSLLVMLLGWFQLKNLFVFSNSNFVASQSISVMSYNVMQFYSKSDAKLSTFDGIKNFVDKETPSILCFQEFKNTNQHKFENFKFSSFDSTKIGLQSAIFSQHRIINSKYFDFEHSGNSAVFADIVINLDTIRVFSAHFQSLNLKPDITTLNEEPKEKLIKRLEKVFKKQINQFDLIKDDIAKSPYPVVFSADMNNTALSYLYHQLTGLELKDSFLESGQYYGKTFNFGALPLRIDMILISESLKSSNFKNYRVDYSDHYPVMTKIQL